MYNSKITGMGHYVPENIVTNNDLSQLIETTDEWIQERTGINQRRWAVKGDGNTTFSMGLRAALNAIKNARIDKESIDFIVFATLSPDYYFPGPGVQIQEALEIDTVGALDIRNQCSGFIYGLSVADQFIKTGMYKNILVIGSELQSRGIDISNRGRSISVIFGDGAGAAILSRENDTTKGILSSHLHSEGAHALELAAEAPGMGKRWVTDIIADNNSDDMSYRPYMNGQFVFKNAIRRFCEVINEGLKTNNLEVSDIDMLVPHQANLRISQYIQKKFQLSDDQVFNNIERYGNTTAASIPIALSEACAKGKIKSGDNVVLAAFGSGFTWGSVILKWT
ncbi:MAG: beta-ketoacyl-ACP synthase III [Bacteroidota bacterium]|nr:beta-ketoacyl-ACP synthase III [Bacteroidota bacterium]